MPLAASAENKVSFNGDIRPILSDNCFACHGPSKGDLKGDLRLDVPDGEFGALTKREDSFSTYIIKPGDPEESELFYRITTDDEDEFMPPEESHKAPLTDEEVTLIRQWIEEGAEYQSFWSFIPPERPETKSVSDADWNENFIDRHVMTRLEKEGLTPKEEADKRTLLRRVTFDLTGLPPTIEELDRFLKDQRPDAYEHVVDDLLSRPAYGEHMTRYWADLVRLADTNGMHKDFNRDFTTYRDWLIRSFNGNLPFDEFVRYQVAGDLFENPTQDQLTASGFNRLHMIIDVGTALPEESLHKNVIDRVEAFGTTFLGLTVQCAQCHDHKYDPISMKDYYQLYGFFNNFSGEPETTRAPERGLQPPFIYLTNDEQNATLEDLANEESELHDIREALLKEIQDSGTYPKRFRKVPVPWIWSDSQRNRDEQEFKATLQLNKTADSAILRFTGMTSAEVTLNGEHLGRAESLDSSIAADVSKILNKGENLFEVKATGKPGFALILEYAIDGDEHTFTTGPDWKVRSVDSNEWQQAQEILKPDQDNDWTTKAIRKDVAINARKLEDVRNRRRSFERSIPAAMVMREREPPRESRMLDRGMYDAPGEVVPRNTPAALPPMKPRDGSYTRLDLANWLVDPGHPLTARVAVNRFWQQFFGMGLVKTSEDFGAQGEWPSHPELLDELAVTFVESGWNVKSLVRDIVLSKTYRQESNATPEEFKRDPENRLLARGSRFRMDAEMIRDQILAVSGKLNRTMYGRSVKPPQPPGLWEMVSMAEPKTYVADTDDNIYRRSLYTYWRRGMPPPQMTIMNAPSREYCVARRERTNTPLQALLLMNEQQYFEAAKSCVETTITEDMETESGLRLLYEKITSLVPEDDRLELMTSTLQDFRSIYADDPELTKALTPELEDADMEARVDRAAWIMLTHSLLNLELTKVRR